MHILFAASWAGQSFVLLSLPTPPEPPLRSFTHVVLVKRDYARELATRTAHAVAIVTNAHAYCVAEADPATRQHPHSEQELGEIARTAATPLGQYIEAETAYVAEEMEVELADGAFNMFSALRWCEGHEAAQKKAEAARDRHAAVVIVTVTQPVLTDRCLSIEEPSCH